jgi:hypothetical protein
MPVGALRNLGARISLKRAANVVFACAWVGFAFGAFIRAADKPVSFTEDIRPVFENSCFQCHGSAIQLSKLDLRTRDGALKGGDRGAAIVPGKAEDSRLYRLVAGLEKPSMPLDGKLTASQIALIKEWINQGALWDATPRDATARNTTARNTTARNTTARNTSDARQTQPPGSPQLTSLEEMPIPPEAGFPKPD